MALNRSFLALTAAASLAAPALAQPGIVYLTAGPDEDFGPDLVRISRDGNFVVGSGTAGLGSQGFYFDVNTFVLVGLPGGTSVSGLCINADGSVLGGDSGAGINRNAAAWTVAAGAVNPVVAMNDLSGGLTLARALAVNDAGTLFAGYGSVTGAVQAATWTFDPTTGTAGAPVNISANLPSDANPNRRSRITAMSGNGSVMAGFYSLLVGQRPMVRVGSTFTALADPQGDTDSGEAIGMSRDGSTIVGYSGADPVVWRRNDLGVYVPTALPTLSNGNAVNGASADGSLLVGESGEAVIWRNGSVLSLTTILTDAGVNLLNLRLDSANDVSDDGRLVTGIASDPVTLQSFGFVAELPAAACPADLGVQGGQPGQDGILNNNDFIAFIDFFFAQNPAADLGSQGGVQGADGQYNNNDFIAFIDLFFLGC